ncbi:MAG: hypothetical protein NTZ45_02325 [Methylococcales bacterium]|jgi:hypothetical protein|nr:hypothetical protein [Methylococcales bacterium]
MSDEKEAGRLILKNLAMFNEAAVFFENEIQSKIQDEFTKIISRWIEENNAWEVTNEENEFIWEISESSSWLSFIPSKWNYETAWFYFGWLDKVESPINYALTDLCGISSTRMGVCFNINQAAFGGVKKWNNSLGQHSNEYIEKLKEFGFIFEKGWGGINTFKLPVKLDVEKLVVAWETDDYEEAFKPLTDALDTLETSWQKFDELIDKVKDDL